jgi:hypothetical protein
LCILRSTHNKSAQRHDRFALHLTTHAESAPSAFWSSFPNFKRFWFLWDQYSTISHNESKWIKGHILTKTNY